MPDRLFPADRAGRRNIRNQARDRLVAKAEQDAAVYGASIKCRRGDHASSPGGCLNDGSDCLCVCHDATGRAACRGFQWIGQTFASCDRCGRPAWEHDGIEEMATAGPLFSDAPSKVRPWKPGELDQIRAAVSREGGGPRG